MRRCIPTSELLESRRLLSTINWVNRGLATDRFTDVFGADAALARSVVDAGLMYWQRAITDFNYSDASNTYDVTIAMSGTENGTGGVGGPSHFLDGKPDAGTLVLQRGDDGAGSGWYLDPTPYDHFEFLGTMNNVYSATAVNGSDPFAQADMLTLVIHEMGHALGLLKNQFTDAFVTDTGIVDSQSGATNAHFYVFNGPSIDHLVTAYDSSPANLNGMAHSARSSTNVTFNAVNYRGANDVMNAIVLTSQRRIVNTVATLMLHDVYGFDVADPATFGTINSMLNSTTGELLIRCPDTASPSADTITISAFGPLLSVSVDLGVDVAGTGHLPGEGNLGAFVSIYNVADVNSITINPGNGNDTITVNFIDTGVGVAVNGGDGNDTLTIGGGDLDTNLSGAITFTGSAGTDTLILNDTTDGAGSDSYNFSGVTLSKPVGDPISWLSTESIVLNASNNNDIITVNSTLPNAILTLNSRTGNDTVNVQSTDLFSPVTITTGSGTDNVNINTDDTGIALAFFPGTELVDALNIGVGGRLALAQAPVANTRVLVTETLSIDNGGVLDLTNGSMILDYSGINQVGAIRTHIANGRNDGNWDGSGITSFAAFAANPAITTLGLLSSTDYFSIYGAGTPFAGQTIDVTCALVKYTYYGDTDFNGLIDFDDYVNIDNGFNNNLNSWFHGDADLNTDIDFDDYVLIDSAFNLQTLVL